MRDPVSGKYVYQHPTKPGVLISRSRLLHLRRKAAGKCPICGRRRPKKAEDCSDVAAAATAALSEPERVSWTDVKTDLGLEETPCPDSPMNS